MELKTYLEILWRRKSIILITAVVTVAIVSFSTLELPPTYTASATLRVATATGGPSGQTIYNLAYADRLMNTYSAIANSRPVKAELMERLGVNSLPAVSISILPNTELMRITAEGGDPILVRDTANTLAALLVEQSSAEYTRGVKTAREIISEQLAQLEDELNQARIQFDTSLNQSPEDRQRIEAVSRSIELKERTYATLLERYQQAQTAEALQANAVSLVEPAVEPQGPSGPNKTTPIALAILLGLVGGIGLAFLFENLDTTLYTTRQIADVTKISPLGTIPAAKRQPTITIFNGSSPQEEAFRRLRTNLLTFDLDNPLRTLLITSAEAGEGKSTIVANLAFSLAKSGRKVIVVDADLRLPTLHTIFDLDNQVGLSNVLEHEVALNRAIQSTGVPEVKVLTSGPLPSNPAELLGSSQMIALLEQLAQQFDMILLDSPAILSVADAAVLAPIVDGVVLVVRRAQTRQETVRAARHQLANVKARFVGIVVNRAEQQVSDHYIEIPAR